MPNGVIAAIKSGQNARNQLASRPSTITPSTGWPVASAASITRSSSGKYQQLFHSCTVPSERRANRLLPRASSRSV